MINGIPSSYRIARETEIHGFTVEPGTYSGIISGNDSDRLADGTYVRHWLKIPGSADRLDVTHLVETGAIEAL
ncbi:hypothetical protein [Devosia sp.]|uniref:hypothetical protein n=1 Tax=Devosia sp. TaxID=1871048 RepID=UPI003264821F